MFIGTNCQDPPHTISKNINAPSYFSDKIDPINGNITLLQTGKMVSHVCPGSNTMLTPLPMTDFSSSACKKNDLRIKMISQNTTFENEINLTTSHYQISAKNDVYGSIDPTDESNHLVLMLLLTFSHEVSADQILIDPIGEPVCRTYYLREIIIVEKYKGDFTSNFIIYF